MLLFLLVFPLKLLNYARFQKKYSYYEFYKNKNIYLSIDELFLNFGKT